MLESVFTDISGSAISIFNLLAAMTASVALGLVISIVYMKTQRDRVPSRSFALTLIILPAVIAVIILLVGTNIASAFSLAGAFSIIRFRSAPGNPKDITYVLLSMAVGLACGMGYLPAAVIIALVLCGVTVALEILNFGSQKASSQLLKITIPENLNYRDAFERVLKKFTVSYSLVKVRTADLGSLYELEYSVITKDEMSEKEFIDELRCRNGNLNITLVLKAQSDEIF